MSIFNQSLTMSSNRQLKLTDVQRAHLIKFDREFSLDGRLDFGSDVRELLNRAQSYLTQLEGDGHTFWLSVSNLGVQFGFAKPEWPGDHWGPYEPEVYTAIVTSLWMYLNGM